MGVFQRLPLLSRPTRLACAVSLFTLTSGKPVLAELPTLAGSWTASPLSSTWQLGDWGKACGPPPSGGGAPGGPVTISQRGNELAFVGAGRGYSTAECWEQQPGLQRISHSGSARNFQNVCKTNPGDPRQAKVVTSIAATDSRISFDETGQYQFVIEGQNCTASVRRTRTYTLVRRAGDAASAAPSAPPRPGPAQAPRPVRDCGSPGLPERLEVRPSRKLLRPGESFAFRTAVLDARGCSIPVSPTWRVLGGAQVLSVTGPGNVTASPTAAESEVAVEVTLGDRSVRVVVEIASRERYDALLASRGLDESGESKEAAVLGVASDSLGAREVVARDEGSSRTRWFVAAVGGAALLLGIIGLVLVRRTRRPAASDLPADEHETGPHTPPAREAKACPTCRTLFPPEAEFCPNDGSRLVSQTGPAALAPPDTGRVVTRSICPMCGAQFTGDIRFCGECSAAVVPIN